MKKFTKYIIVALICAFCAIFAIGCSKSEKLEPGDISVTLNSKGDELTVTVMPKSELLEVYADSELILFMLEAGKDFGTGEGLTELGRRKADGFVTFKADLYENGRSRLYSTFTAAFFDSATNVYVEAVNGAAYVANPETLSKNDSDYIKKDSIKGLNARCDSEALTLGVSHAMIDIYFEDYLLPEGDADAISYIFGGKSYYLDRAAVESLDERVRLYTENGVAVYFRFLLGEAQPKLSGSLACLAYPGAPEGEKTYAVNMSDPDCSVTVASFADFMAERYTRSDGEYGLVSAFVAGDNVNTPGKTAAASSAQSYYGSSFAFVRTLYTAMASHYANGRVYVDVDNKLTVSDTGACDSSVQAYLRALAAHTAYSGDYPWGVSASVKATSADPDRIWYDNSGNGSYLTPSNLGALVTDFMASPELAYGDGSRNVMIGDFSVSVGMGENTENNQAASYAYAYYKALAAGNIDAFIYSSQSDTENDRSGIHGTNLEEKPETTRKIYSVFRDIDTDADVNAMVGQTLTDSDWQSLYTSYGVRDGVSVSCTGGVTVSDPSTYSSSVFVDFSDGSEGGFVAVGDGSFTSLVPNASSSALRAYLAKSDASDSPYIVKKGIERSDIRNDNVLVTLSAVGGKGSTATSFRARIELIQYNKNKKDSDVRYVSSVQDLAPNTSVTLAFDVEEAVDAFERGDIELRIYAEGNNGGDCILTVERILTGKAKSNVWLITLLCVLAALSLTAGGILFVMWFRKNYEIQLDRPAKKSGGKKKGKKDGGNAVKGDTKKAEKTQ